MNKKRTWEIVEEFNNGNKIVKEIKSFGGYYGMVNAENQLISKLIFRNL